MIPTYELRIVVPVTFSSTIFYILLLSERRVRCLLGRRAAMVPEDDIRFVLRVRGTEDCCPRHRPWNTVRFSVRGSTPLH